MSGAPLVILLATAPAGPAAAPGPVTLVLPLEPAEAADAHAWVGPAVSQLLARGLAAAGVPVAGRVEQLRAQAALELPRVSLTRATSLRIAEALGAGRLVVGTYQLQADELQVSLRLLDVARASLSTPIVASSPLVTLSDLAHGLAWDVALAGPTPPAVTRDAFLECGRARDWIRHQAIFSHLLSLLFEPVRSLERGPRSAQAAKGAGFHAEGQRPQAERTLSPFA